MACLLSLVACDAAAAAPDAGTDAWARTCDHSLTYTTQNQPPCTWEWTCDDFSGSRPQYSADCVAGTGDDVTCECREAGTVTGSMILADGCVSFVEACQAANAACGLGVPITCSE